MNSFWSGFEKKALLGISFGKPISESENRKHALRWNFPGLVAYQYDHSPEKPAGPTLGVGLLTGPQIGLRFKKSPSQVKAEAAELERKADEHWDSLSEVERGALERAAGYGELKSRKHFKHLGEFTRRDLALQHADGKKPKEIADSHMRAVDRWVKDHGDNPAPSAPLDNGASNADNYGIWRSAYNKVGQRK
jgi:hypothetical protein